MPSPDEYKTELAQFDTNVELAKAHISQHIAVLVALLAHDDKPECIVLDPDVYYLVRKLAFHTPSFKGLNIDLSLSGEKLTLLGFPIIKVEEYFWKTHFADIYLYFNEFGPYLPSEPKLRSEIAKMLMSQYPHTWPKIPVVQQQSDRFKIVLRFETPCTEKDMQDMIHIVDQAPAYITSV